MTPLEDAKDNLQHWKEAYQEDLDKGRDPWEFGMQFTANQIFVWEEEIKKLENET